jgi:hypothetical protein
MRPSLLLYDDHSVVGIEVATPVTRYGAAVKPLIAVVAYPLVVNFLLVVLAFGAMELDARLYAR